MVRPTGRLLAYRNRSGRRQSQGLSHVPYLSASTNSPNDHELPIWRPAFPGPELVGAAADLIPHIRDDGGRDSVMREGPRWQIVVSPGVIRVKTRDVARAERTRERAAEARRREIDMRVTWLADGEEAPEPLPTRGTIFA